MPIIEFSQKIVKETQSAAGFRLLHYYCNLLDLLIHIAIFDMLIIFYLRNIWQS